MTEPDENSLHYIEQLLLEGNLQEAHRQLIAFVQRSPRSAPAWMLLSEIVTEKKQKQDCLEMVLRLTPGNRQAHDRLAELKGETVVNPPAVGSVSPFSFGNGDLGLSPANDEPVPDFLTPEQLNTGTGGSDSVSPFTLGDKPQGDAVPGSRDIPDFLSADQFDITLNSTSPPARSVSPFARAGYELETPASGDSILSFLSSEQGEDELTTEPEPARWQEKPPPPIFPIKFTYEDESGPAPARPSHSLEEVPAPVEGVEEEPKKMNGMFRRLLRAFWRVIATLFILGSLGFLGYVGYVGWNIRAASFQAATQTKVQALTDRPAATMQATWTPRPTATPTLTGTPTIVPTITPTVDELVTGPRTGLFAPNFVLNNVFDEVEILTNYKGRPIVIVFWKINCPACEDQMPGVKAIARSYKADGLVVLAVNVGDSVEEARAYQEANEIEFPILIDLDQAIMLNYQVSSLPTNYFINREGRIVKIQAGAMPQSDMIDEVQVILEK
ncbi:MAG: TlpA family protein disulfide reductase [Anaerolineales bacterium]|nr:TlpA family protein disulfide reductase [Anaerolineales bacterium]